MSRWVLLGLTEDGAPGFRSDNMEVIPPLVHFPAGLGRLERDRVAVMGYDKQTLLTGARLLDLLPADQKADFFIAPQWEGFLRGQCRHLDRPGVRVLALPSDADLYGSLAARGSSSARPGSSRWSRGFSSARPSSARPAAAAWVTRSWPGISSRTCAS